MSVERNPDGWTPEQRAALDARENEDIPCAGCDGKGYLILDPHSPTYTCKICGGVGHAARAVVEGRQ